MTNRHATLHKDISALLAVCSTYCPLQIVMFTLHYLDKCTTVLKPSHGATSIAITCSEPDQSQPFTVHTHTPPCVWNSTACMESGTHSH